MDITKIDKNFAAVEISRDGFDYFEVKNKPFSLEGLPWLEHNKGAYYRLPLETKSPDVNEGVLGLCNHTSGVCVRFCSDSPEIHVCAELFASCDMNHMTRCGSAGFDSYCNGIYSKTVRVEANQFGKEIESLAGVNTTGKTAVWQVNFPLYGGVKKVMIGLKSGSTLLPPPPHKVKKPIVFYGSSITQGGCASRPGNMYPSLLCRALDAEQINLGFSGSAKGEPAMAELIAQLDPSVFVLDYDHNASSAEELLERHEPFFKIIRKAHPNLPIVIATKSDIDPENHAQDPRRNAILKTYENAIKNGDRNVYFVDGVTLFAEDCRDACTVDGCHPNDLGFYRMYKGFLPVLQKILGQ